MSLKGRNRLRNIETPPILQQIAVSTPSFDSLFFSTSRKNRTGAVGQASVFRQETQENVFESANTFGVKLQ